MSWQPPVQVTLRLDKTGVVGPLQRILKDSFNNVALGLHAMNQYQTDVLPKLPTSFSHFGFGQPEEELTEEQLEHLKEGYRTWMLTAAFGDFIRAVFAALQEAHLYCEVATAWPATFRSADEMRAYLDSIKAKALKFDLPTLIDRVSARLNAPMELRDHILSINKVRNCLEHRHGIVREQDVNSASSALVMMWRRSKVYYERNGKEIDVTPGCLIEGPATVMHRFEDVTKAFNVGDTIQLSVDEFNEVMFTCAALGDDLVSKLPDVPVADT